LNASEAGAMAAQISPAARLPAEPQRD